MTAKRCLAAALVLVALSLFSSPARADCTIVSGPQTYPAGAIIYNTTQGVLQYCAGTVWRALGGAAGTDGPLPNLTDVDDGLAPVDGECLVYSGANTQWETGACGSGGGGDLDDLNNVDVTGATDGQCLVYNNALSQWEDGSCAAGGATALTGLTDVDVAGVADGACLVYNNGTSKWEDGACGSGGGGLTCPSGFTKIENQGQVLGCMQTAENGSGVSWEVAANTCYTAHGGRLPTTAEWYLAVNNYALTNENDNSEWNADLVGDNEHAVSGTAVTNQFFNADSDTGNAYRCFIPAIGGGGGGAANLTDLGDIDVTGVADGACLVYNNTSSKWEDGACGSGGGGGMGAWSDVSASRVMDTNYTNNTGSPLVVSIILDAIGLTQQRSSLVIDGVIVSTITPSDYYSGSAATAHYSTLLGIVPPGATYQAQNSNGTATVIDWFEATLSGGGGGDNLGDHTATQDINLATNDILNAGGITSATASVLGGPLTVDNNTDGTNKGCIRFNGTSNKLEFSHDCTTYAEMGSGSGGGGGTGLEICLENDNCTGTPVLCSATAPDGAYVYANNTGGGPITYGAWSNAQCGTSGTGWHIDNHSSCSTGAGTRDAGCAWVMVQTTGGSGDNLGDHTATTNIQLGANYLSGDGGSEGLTVDADGNVGVGVADAATNLEVNGALRLSGTGTDLFLTPTAENVPTKINIPLFDPGAFGQILISGLPASAQATARAMTFVDARAAAHQPTVGVFSPDENNLLGFSWEGSNTVGYLKSTGTDIAIRSNATDIATFLAGGNVGIGESAPAERLHVQGTIRVDNNADTTNKGCIRYNGTSNKLEFSHDCATYAEMGSGGSGGGGDAVSIQTFTANGTWNRPAGVTKIEVYVTGGGGGGGGSTASNVSGAGGGAGGTAICVIDVTSLSSAAVVVGTGGTAGTSTGGGGNGNTSSFNGAGCSASGGTGGGAGSISPGAAGGIGSGGLINLSGGGSGSGGDSSTGFGGASYWGGGGRTLINGVGIAGAAYGSGGSGGVNNSGTARAGGAGAGGIVVVKEYYGGGGGGGGGSSTLAGLTDVDVAGAANGNCLVYNNGTSKWEDGACGAGGGDDLGDHTATQDLNMAGFNLTSGGAVILNGQTTGAGLPAGGGGGSTLVSCTKVVRSTATFTPAAGMLIGYTLFGGGGGGSNSSEGANGAETAGYFSASGGSITVYVGGGGGGGAGSASGGAGGSGYFGGGGSENGGGGGSTAILDNGTLKAYAAGGNAGGPTPATGGSNVAGAAGNYGSPGASLAGGNSWHSSGGSGATGGARETGGGGGGYGGGGGGSGATGGSTWGGDGGSSGRNGGPGGSGGGGGGSGNGFGGGGARLSGGNGGIAIITYQAASCSL